MLFPYPCQCLALNQIICKHENGKEAVFFFFFRDMCVLIFVLAIYFLFDLESHFNFFPLLYAISTRLKKIFALKVCKKIIKGDLFEIILLLIYVLLNT